MAITTFGDPRAFAIGHTLVPDPDGLYPSWGSLTLWVDGRRLTRGRLPDGSVIDTAEVPLLPLAIWFVAQWDALFHEGRLPWRDRKAMTAAEWVEEASATVDFATGDDLFEKVATIQEYRSRHALGTALPGYRLPDITFRRFEDQMEVSWTNSGWRGVDGGIRLLKPSGAVLVSKAELATTLLSWLQSVSADLSALVGSEADGLELNHSIACLLSAKRNQQWLGWLLGERVLAHLDPAEVQRVLKPAKATTKPIGDPYPEVTMAFLSTGRDVPRRDQWRPQGPYLDDLPAPLMLFKSTSPDISKADARTLWDATSCIPSGDASELRALARPEIAWGTGREVTADGYDRAIELRDSLQIPDDVPLTGDRDLASDVLVRLGVSVTFINLDDQTIEGAAVWQTGRVPTIFVNQNGRFSASPTGLRMTLAHELCHLLFDLDDHGQVGTVSNPWAEYALERRANAFAAMLLMPEAAVSAFLPADPDTWTTTLIREAMASLGVGTVAFMRHLENIGFIDSPTRDYWMTALTAESR